MFNWLKQRRRKKILSTPFNETWRHILNRGITHYSYLDETEREQLEQLIQVFVYEKNFEGCGDMEITDEVKITIAAQACMLVLNLPHDLYRRVESILVYPSTVVSRSIASGFLHRTPQLEKATPILGQAHMYGPVILVWDAVKQGAVHPERGHNVVYHEFAHKLDMLDGAADGVPPLHDTDQYESWYEICSTEFEILRSKTNKRKKTLLDPYGATNAAEFFAVATEYFFDKPQQMKSEHNKLYAILSNYYNQDPAAREHRYKTTTA